MRITILARVDDSAWEPSRHTKYGLIELELKRDCSGRLYWTWLEMAGEDRMGAIVRWRADDSIFNDLSIIGDRKVLPRIIVRKSEEPFSEGNDRNGQPFSWYEEGDI